MKNVLLTGFEPFDGADVNPSWEAVRLVPGVRAVQLPCVFGEALEHLRAAVLEHEPSVVVCVGQAGGRSDVTVERVAINLDDARIPDNAGRRRTSTAARRTPRGGPRTRSRSTPSSCRGRR
jgi:pyroglutamyl-peptidase